MTQNTSPKVSIMIPTYNQSGVILDAVQSALEQDYDNLEIIIADDHSPDDTETVVRDFMSTAQDPRLVYHRNPKNLGRVGNYRNTLYNHATGEWALNLDGDDHLIDPGFISTAVQEIQKHDNVVMVGAGTRIEHENWEEDVLPCNEVKLIPGFELLMNWDTSSVYHLGALYNRPLAVSIDFYRKDILSTDFESLLRLIQHGDVVLLNRVAGAWRISDDNPSQDLNFELEKESFLRFHAAVEQGLELGRPASVLHAWRRRIIAKNLDDYMGLVLLALAKPPASAHQDLRQNLKKLHAYISLKELPFLQRPKIALKLCLFKLLGPKLYSALFLLKNKP